MTTRKNEGPGALPPEIRCLPIRLALSGGGFRATLFSLGSLLYLVDSGQQRDVRSIYSVSGASVLNALVAQSTDFADASVNSIDRVAVGILRTVTRRGLLLSSWLTAAYVVALLLGILFVFSEAVFSWPLDASLPLLAGVLSVTATVALLRGVVIAQLLSRQFFRGDSGPSTLACATGRTLHVLCATDLNSGAPAYFSLGGSTQPTLWTRMGHTEVPTYRLDHAVRASAAFPGGIPPKRVSLRRVGLSWSERTHRVAPALQLMAQRLPKRRAGSAIYLADGGVYNNLATDEVVSRESDGAEILMVVDASAPMKTSRLRLLGVPIIAEMVSLVRSMGILYSNTVEPRIADFENRGALALRNLESGSEAADFPLVIRITDNASDGIRRLRRTHDLAGIGVEPLADEDLDRLARRSRMQWNAAAKELSDRYRHRVMAVRSSAVPTTFGRIDPQDALGLMIHGYLASMIALAHSRGAPNGHVDIDRFERLLRFEPGDSPGFRDDGGTGVSDTL